MDVDRRALVLGMMSVPLDIPAAMELQQSPIKPDIDVLRRELGIALKSLVRVEIARAGARQSPDSSGLTERLIDQGVDNLFKREQVIETLSISLAVDGARRFGRELVLQADRQNDGSLRIGEGTFAKAQGRMCPFYPFC